MTTEVTTRVMDAGDQDVARYLGLNPANPADRAAVAVARHYSLDPVLKHVIVIPKGGVYITRDGLLHIAHRSGQLDGIVVEREPELIDGEWVCRVSVYRKDMRFPFTYPGRYSASGSNKTYAQEMALKAAESHALRRAFDITGLGTADEVRPSSPGAQSVAEVIGGEVDNAADEVAFAERIDAPAEPMEALQSGWDADEQGVLA